LIASARVVAVWLRACVRRGERVICAGAQPRYASTTAAPASALAQIGAGLLGRDVESGSDDRSWRSMAMASEEQRQGTESRGATVPCQ